MKFTSLGNYELVKHLHPERNSKTYIVKHKFTGENFVLKIVVSEEEAKVRTLERTFTRLTKGLSKLNNPQTVQFKDYFVTELEGKKCFVLVSEFFAGKELYQFISGKGAESLGFDRLKKIFTSVCSVIRDAHKIKYQDDHGVEVVGFPHGDIVPWNILINENYDLKLLDFKLINRFTFSESKMQYKEANTSKEWKDMPISKSGDISQLGYLLNYLFAKNHDYFSGNLEGKNLKDILDGLDRDKVNKKYRTRIGKIIYKCTREEASQYQNVQGILDDLEGKDSGVRVKNIWSKAIKAIIVAAVAFIAIDFYNNGSISVVATGVSDSRGLQPESETGGGSAVKVGEYYALMIGNDQYQNIRSLTNPIKDVKRLNTILTTNYGFKSENIITKYNASRDDVYDGFEQITAKVKKNDNLVIFYAGHGQLHEETGYWIPVEARDKSRRDWISNSEIKKFINSISARNVLVLSDACFGGTILRDITSVDEGLAKMSNKKTRIALTSGSAETVPDHSVFIEQLFDYLETTPDSLVFASQIFSGIREGIVSNTTNDPGYGPIRDSGHQGGDFFFIKK